MSIFLVVLCLTSSVFAQGSKPKPNRFPSVHPGGPLGGLDIDLPPVVFPTDPAKQPVCPEFGIFQAPDRTSCRKFILCNNGIARPHNCSEGTHFNIERGICIDREIANCDLCRFNREPVKFLPLEGSCTRYVVCFGTNRLERECANGFHFNPKTSQCDRRENVECTEENLNIPTIACPNSPNVLFVPSLHSCEGYFVCAHGSPSFHNCSEGLIFDIHTNQCGATGRCLLDYVPNCGPEISFEPHVYDCRHYFFCSNGQPVLNSCAPGLLFDIVSRQCNVDTIATCGNPPNGHQAVWPHLLN